MGTTIVASGCMEIREHGLLKAYLGSCVGVAVLDGTRRLGGLIHLLLPEPVCSVPSYQLASYASTGIPLFLEALADHGASMDNLSAFVAGGALIDPARTDLAMNIGGKTLDVTLRMLERYRIPIRRLEANGITGMCIMLDVEGRSCTIEPVTERPVAQRSKDLPMPTLSDIDRTIRSLKPIPQIALSIAEMISDDTTDLAGIASEIKKDQVLSADVLRLCNSAFLGVPRKIESIDEAVAVVGTSTLMQLVITAHMERLIGCSESGYSLMRGGLYFHSLATARLSERLARASGVAGPQTAYTCGLLHDIGKVVLDQYMAGVRPLFYRSSKVQGHDSSTFERMIFGIDHSLAGFHLAEAWGLPAVVKDAVLFHHTPDGASSDRVLMHVVRLADALSLTFLPGLVMENLDAASFEDSMLVLGLSPEKIQESLSVLVNVY